MVNQQLALQWIDGCGSNVPTHAPAVPTAPHARASRDEGIARAHEHAEKEARGWTEEAIKQIVTYARTHTEPFLVEEVREWAEALGFPSPPDARSWGHATAAAAKRSLIVKDGARAARSSNMAPKYTWRIA